MDISGKSEDNSGQDVHGEAMVGSRQDRDWATVVGSGQDAQDASLVTSCWLMTVVGVVVGQTFSGSTSILV